MTTVHSMRAMTDVEAATRYAIAAKSISADTFFSWSAELVRNVVAAYFADHKLADERSAFEAWWLMVRDDLIHDTDPRRHAESAWYARAAASPSVCGDVQWSLVNPQGKIVAVEDTCVKAWARISGYKPTVEGLLGYEQQGWRVLSHTSRPMQAAAGVPFEAISKILNEVMEHAVANGADSRSMPDEYVAVAHFVSYPEKYGYVVQQTAQASSYTTPVAWVRKHPDTGALSGDWLWNDNIEQCRKDSGVWFPLGFIHAAQPAREDHECTYENGDGVCRECAELAQMARLEASVRRYQEMVDVLKQRLHDVTHPEAVEPQTSETKAATGLGWRVRELRAKDGTLMDCFVEAPAEGDMPYGLQVLGDDYTGYGDLARKHEHCKMIVEWANRND